MSFGPPGVLGGEAEAEFGQDALLCGRRSDWDAFGALFDAYWFGDRVRARVAVSAT